MIVTEERSKVIFDEFLKRYDMKNSMIHLKYMHTFRVAKNAKKLATELKMSKEEVSVAYIIGVLHDIGRFYQVTNFNTFSDFEIKNFDHGDLGEKILLDGELLKYISGKDYDKYSNVILNSVKFHNKFKLDKIPEYVNLSDIEKKFVKIIRDADKLDILYIVSNKDINLEEDYDYTNLDISDSVYESLIKNVEVRYEDVKNKIDCITTHIGYVFDINFKESFNYIKDKEYISKYIDIFEYNNETRVKMDYIKEHINSYIESKIK